MCQKKTVSGDEKNVAVLFRLDANWKTGLGHLSRCLNLAKECLNQGRAINFAGNLDHDARDRITAAGGIIFDSGSNGLNEDRETKESGGCFRSITPGPDSGEDQIKPEPVREPARELALLQKAAKTAGAQVLITDCYTLPAGYHLQARKLFPLVVTIDDLNAAPPAAHILINHNIFAPDLAYQPIFPETKLLLGPRYALLPAAFRSIGPKEIRSQVKNILVTLGGSDPSGLTLRAVKALQLSGVGAVWNVVAGPGFAKKQELKRLAASERRINPHFAPATLLPLLTECDLVICAGGVTAYEAATTGTPALIYILAENQRANAEEMDMQGIAMNLGWGEATPKEVIAEEIVALARDVRRRTRMSETGRALFDGYGPVRCAGVIQKELKFKIRR